MPEIREKIDQNSYAKLEDVYTTAQIERTDKLRALKGSTVELSDTTVDRLAHQHFSDLRNASPSPLKEKSFTLVMGANGSGKTSQVVPMILAEKGRAILICTDQVRPKVAQAFREEKGEGNYQEPMYTQTAARNVSLKCQDLAMGAGFNIIATTVGYAPSGVENILKFAKNRGYQPHLVCAAISPKKAVERIFYRNERGAIDQAYAERQPFQDPLYTLPTPKYPTTPEDVFDKIAAKPTAYGLASVTKYDTNVSKDEPPKLVKQWRG